MKKAICIVILVVSILCASISVFADPYIVPDGSQRVTSPEPVIIVPVLNPVPSN